MGGFPFSGFGVPPLRVWGVEFGFWDYPPSGAVEVVVYAYGVKCRKGDF